MKIAIKFGDNDFHSTFRAVLEVLHSSFKYNGSLPMDKEKLCFMINTLSPILYLTHQNTYAYNGLEKVTNASKTEENEEYQNTKKYLQITPDRILLNNEVTEYCKEVGFSDNSETYILDTDLDFVNNEAIYSL